MKEKPTLKKWHIVLLVVIGVVFLFLKLWQMSWPEANIVLKNQPLHVLLANDFYRQYRGLGKRETLGKFDGMLFVYNFYERPGIVMRAMRFPIDIVWFNHNKVIDMAKNVPVEPGVREADLRVYYPRGEANLVLELPAGWIDKNSLKIGDLLFVTGSK